MFSTLYTSIPHDLLKYRISNLVHNAFRKEGGSVRYTHIKVTRAKGYFTHDINGSEDNMYTADNICKMVNFLIDNIFVQFGGRLFHQVIGIPVGTNCAPLLADLFLYSYENEFPNNMIRGGHRRLARNLCYWWFTYEAIKNVIMQIMINLLPILIWPIRLYNMPLYQI